MTSLQLLSWILGGIALQVAIYLAYAFAKHWRGYVAMKHAAREGGYVPEADTDSSQVTHLAQGWPGFTSFTVVGKQVEDGKGEVCSFYLRPDTLNALPLFKPGQFLTFELEITSSAGNVEKITRCYSLSDAPGKDTYRVTIKRVPTPPASDHRPGRSSNHFHDHVHIGSKLRARAPGGHFYLDEGNAPIVLIAGGVGITPMLSMINWCAAHQAQREVWLFYGVRNAMELVMPDHLRALAQAHPTFKIHLCLSDLGADANQAGAEDALTWHRSRVDIQLLRSLLPLKPLHFYLCGPTAMLQSLVPALDDWGVSDAHIHFEAFGPASIPRKRPSVTTPQVDGRTAYSITFNKSGKQCAWKLGTGNLLEFAEANGIAVSSGCRSGSCGSCQTPMVAGEVAYAQRPDFDPEPGSCLLCVAIPKTDLVLEA